MTANDDTQSGDLSPTDRSNGNELQTDGGTRRRFLGAAAAALALVPAVGAAETGLGGDERDITVDENPSTGDYRVSGEMFSTFVTEKYTDEASYTVSSHPGDPNAQVSLEIWNEHASLGLDLTKQQAEQLAAFVLDAAREGDDE